MWIVKHWDVSAFKLALFFLWERKDWGWTWIAEGFFHFQFTCVESKGAMQKEMEIETKMSVHDLWWCRRNTSQIDTNMGYTSYVCSCRTTWSEVKKCYQRSFLGLYWTELAGSVYKECINNVHPMALYAGLSFDISLLICLRTEGLKTSTSIEGYAYKEPSWNKHKMSQIGRSIVLWN